MGVRNSGLMEMVGLRQNVLIFFVITLAVAKVFAHPMVIFENQENGDHKTHTIPTTTLAKRSNDLLPNDLADLQSQMAEFQLSQGPLMSAMKEAFIRSFKHKMDFDISTPHGFLAFMNKNYNRRSPNAEDRNIIFPA